MTAVNQRLPEPYGHVEVTIAPWVATATGEELSASVEIMNRDTGRGTMRSVAYAIAEADAILAVVRQYRGDEAPIDPDELASVAQHEISRLRTQVQTLSDLGALAEERLREARAEGWREGFITSTGMDRGYSASPGSFPWAGDDEDLDAWNPYTGDGYRDPYSEDDDE